MASWKGIILRFLVKIFNLIHSIFRVFGKELVPLNFDEVVKPLTPEERAEVIFQNYDEPLRIIFDGCNKPSSTISGFHRHSLRQTMRSYIMTTTMIKTEIAKNPDITKTPINGPIVIVGLARSGTTMLQRLLACDPQFISPMTWEMLNPTPPGRPENWRKCRRYRAGAMAIESMVAMQSDEVKAMHTLAADQNEECLMLLRHCFLNICDSLIPDLQGFRDFQVNCPKDYQKKSYEYYKMALQCLFYKNVDENKTLLLKSPAHLLFLDTYKEVIPNAKFIFTYRHLGTMIASSCSLMHQTATSTGTKVDRKFIARQNLDLYKVSCERAVKAFKNMSEDSFITMGYSEIIQDSMAAVKNIYDHFNLELTPEVEASMQRHLQNNRQNKYGRHKYSLEDFKITEEDLKTEFKEFLEYFKDKPEVLI